MKKLKQTNKKILMWCLLLFLFIGEIILFLTKTQNDYFDIMFWVIFVIIYIVRWKKGHNMKKEILDLPLLIPLFLIDNASLSLFLRYIFIVSMYFDYFIDLIDDFILHKKLLLILVAVFTLQFLGGIGLMVFENISFADAQWLTFITATTVGYGDISAVTRAGQLITVFITISGALVYSALLITSIIEWVAKLKEEEFQNMQKQATDEENVNVVIASFEQFKQGNITISSLEQIVINELSKKDNE